MPDRTFSDSHQGIDSLKNCPTSTKAQAAISGPNSTQLTHEKKNYSAMFFKLTFLIGLIGTIISLIGISYGWHLPGCLISYLRGASDDDIADHSVKSVIFTSKDQRNQANTAEHDIYDISYMPEIPPDLKNRTQIGIENATLFMLVRNFEVLEALGSMRQIEDRFNRKYRYPWVFLNDEEFTDEFKYLTRGLASGEAYYGYIPPEVWQVPPHINQTKMRQNMKDMEERDVLYASSLSYRNMCRFNSGNFFRHPLMNNYDYYWRVEPGVKYYCDQLYDPFTFMRENNKIYGFVITILEYPDTIPTLWNTSQEFFDMHPDYIVGNSARKFLTDKNALRKDDLVLQTDSDYNMCHFWSNFEIADLNFFRSKPYLEYFDYLDQKGGFYYERWGDAPVHSIALASMVDKSQIHHFSDIGYMHPPYYRCPHDDASYASGRCVCEEFRGNEVDFKSFSCLPKWWYHAGRQFVFNFTGSGGRPLR